MRRSIHIFPAGVSLLFFFVLMLHQVNPCMADGAPPYSMRVSYWRIIDDLPFFVAIEEGFFKEEGLDVQLVRLGGTTNLIAAVIKGEIQAGSIDVPSLCYAAQKELPITLGAWLGKTHPGTRCGLHVNAASGLHGIDDLRGKRIALSGAISTRMVLHTGLAQHGMTMDDVEAVMGIQLDEPMKHEAALKSGWVDVIMA